MTPANEHASVSQWPEIEPVTIAVAAGPTSEQIDTMIRNFVSAQQWKKAATELEDECKQALVRVVRDFGHPEPGSEHSRRIKGQLNTALVTEVTTTTLNEAKVLELRSLLSYEDRAQLFRGIFAERVKHQVVAGAVDKITAAYMPKWLRAKVESLFGQCFHISDASPRVKVDMIAAEPKQRKPRAKKQAVQS